MSVQRQRSTRTRRDRKRRRFKIIPKKMVKCQKCGAFILPHCVCPKCGYYKNHEIVNTLKKSKRNKSK